MTSMYLGLDLGHHSIVTASSRTEEPFNVQVDANALSNRSTPALVGLENNRILCGEEAETRIGSVPHKIVSSFPQYFSASNQKTHGPFETVDEPVSLETAHLFSLFFRNYMAQVHASVPLQFLTISVPPTFGPAEVTLLIEAALLSGLVEGQFDIIDHLDAAFTTLIHKEGGHLGEKAVMVVDIGFAHTSVGLWSSGLGSPVKFGFGQGVSNMIEIVGDLLTGRKNFLSDLKKKDGRFYFRFFKVCEKALKELSMLPTTIVDLGDFDESFEKHGISGLKKTRVLNKLELENSLGNFVSQLETSISSCLMNLPDRTRIASVEVVGGGSRVPFIAQSIAEICKIEKVGRGLDGSAFSAVGAGLWSAGKRGWAGSRLSPDLVASASKLAGLLETQTRVESAHAQEVLKLGRKNELESFLYKIQYLLQDTKSAALIEVPPLEEALSECRAWFNSVEDGETELADNEGIEFVEKKNVLEKKFQTHAEKYLSKLDSDKTKVENSLTANAEYLKGTTSKETAAEKRDKHGKEEVSLKLASKNRDEGNELFKHGTPTDAMNRYMRALNIIAKLGKSPESDPIALACNLNMVQCVIRLTGSSSPLTPDERNGLLKRGIACADSALAIDKGNSKAKYRKAVCLDRMKDTEAAKKVIDEALQTDPDNDDLQRLYNTLMASLKEQQSKAKKFFGKMFQ